MVKIDLTKATPKQSVSGVVLYRGPSQLDGQPIVVVATGLGRASRNEKTGGGLIQTWIIRSDVAPHEAIKSGDDASICGDCPHRGRIVDGKLTARSCYVIVHNAPLSVFKAFHRGVYPEVSPEVAGVMLAGRGVRLGSYGDPAAVPFAIWEAALSRAAFHTGYTHQWRTAPELAQFCMASCDTADERVQAKFLGFRTFRVTPRGELPGEREIVCPASVEAGQKTSCDACRACGGLTAKARVDIVIAAHGGGAGHVERRAAIN